MTEFTLSGKPRASRIIEEVVANTAENTGHSTATLNPLVMILIQTFLPMLAQVLNCPGPKPPPDPTPTPTAESAIANQNAAILKSQAERAFLHRKSRYKANKVRQMADKISEQHTAEGDPIDEETAHELAIQALDAARETPHAMMVATILEAQGH